MVDAGSVAPRIEGWKTVEARVKAVTMTPLNADTAAEFNRYKIYGFENWKAGEAKDVAGLKWDSSEEAEMAKDKVYSYTLTVENDKLLGARYKKQPDGKTIALRSDQARDTYSHK